MGQGIEAGGQRKERSASRAPDSSSKRRRNLWATGATLLAIAGVAGATLGALKVAENDAARSRAAFAASSAEVASTLRLALLHEEDLVVSAQAFIAGDPDATNTEFGRWSSSVRAFERYPELVGFGFSEMIHASRLAAFAARVTADPPAPLGPGGRFRVLPSGQRPYYCLAAAARSRSATIGFPAGFDYCAADPTGARLWTRDSGRTLYSPITVAGRTSLLVSAPVYRGGLVPSTLFRRRVAFLGWIGMAVVPEVVLNRALEGHPGMAATLSYRQGRSEVSFSTGSPSPGAQRVSQSLRNGWTVQTSGAVDAGGMLGNGGALALLGAGIAVSVLLAALVFVLGTGRARARRLVDEKTDELRHQALHDPLTGLANRALVMDRIEQLLARNRRAGTPAAAMFIDLDGFKNINDRLGHEAGDALLRAVGERLAGCLRESDTLARMGGDEFVVLLDGGSLSVAPELVAERLLDVLRHPFELVGASIPVTVSASIGIAVGDRSSPGALLRDADVAMYLAKATGKNRYEVFSPELESDVRDRNEIEFELRSALEADQFRLVYQPIYSLDDLSVIGVEALLRWDHPTLGLIPPDKFIPLLEASGHILEVGRFVLIKACLQMAAWQARGGKLGLAVNVSARQLDHDSVVSHVREALDLSGLDPTTLTLEVTETALMRDPETTVRRLQELKAIGLLIAVDDFGTGYSSLAYLQRFPVDSLKIDRAFTDGINRSPASQALIHTLVQLGRDLGLRTLAEGVETRDQVEHLRGEHVDEAQGYLLARPLDAETFETTMLRDASGPAPDPLALSVVWTTDTRNENAR